MVHTIGGGAYEAWRLVSPQNFAVMVHIMANKSSAVAEIGDRDHRSTDMGRKEGGGCCAPFTESWDPV